MTDFTKVSVEMFRILRSFNYELLMYDETGNQTYEPDQARRFFAKPKNLTLAIMDQGENSYVQLGISHSVDINEVLGLIERIRTKSKDFNLMSKVRKHDRELRPKDLSLRNLMYEAAANDVILAEGMYGTSKTSYLKLENARLIVRHSAAVTENVIGARSRNIDRIFVENAIGERFLFPTTALAPARAMVQHCNHGGGFADEIGQQIGRMAQTFANLGTCARHIYSNGAVLEATTKLIRENCRAARHDMRRLFERLYRNYDGIVETVMERARVPLDEAFEGRLVEYADTLKARLAVEGKELGDAVLESVARALLDRETEEMIDLPKIGYRVEKAAWEALKAGNIEFDDRPVLDGSLPERLRQVADATVAPELRKMIGDIAERIEGGARDRIIHAIAAKAIDATAKLKETVIQTGAVEAFESWFHGLSAEAVLAENAVLEDVHDDAEYDRMLAAVVSGFDADAFVANCGDDLGATVQRSYVRNKLIDYLSAEISHLVGSEDDHAAEMLADRLIGKVEKAIAAADVTLSENDDFSIEDVIIPGNAADDLRNEVVTGEYDEEDVSRMRRLAGVDTIKPPQF